MRRRTVSGLAFQGVSVLYQLSSITNLFLVWASALGPVWVFWDGKESVVLSETVGQRRKFGKDLERRRILNLKTKQGVVQMNEERMKRAG